MELSAQAPSAMFSRIVAHVAGLAQSGQVAWSVVPRVVIEMRGG